MKAMAMGLGPRMFAFLLIMQFTSAYLADLPGNLAPQQFGRLLVMVGGEALPNRRRMAIGLCRALNMLGCRLEVVSAIDFLEHGLFLYSLWAEVTGQLQA